MSRANRCDRCGEFYLNSFERYDGEVAELKTIEIYPKREKYKYWDLCPDCTNKLNKWLKNEPFKEES